MRQDLLQLAQTFLTSESVQSADKKSKIQFLRNKGLDDEEIEEAFKRAGVVTKQNLSLIPRVPPRPSLMTQIIYLPPTHTPRLTNIQLVSYAISLAVGIMGLTVAITTAIKKIMSNILRAIANYQADRYKQTATLLNRINSCIQAQQTNTSFETEQNKLNDSLYQLVQLTLQIKEGRQTYKSLRSDVKQFTDTILQTSLPPTHSTYVTGGFSNRYQDSNNEAIQNVKSEIRSFKGMLLSRRNFPVATAPAVTPVNLTSRHSIIPAPVEPSPIYHPRRKRSFRHELAPLVKDAT